MTKVVGVKFKKAGKMYYFDPAGYKLKNDDNVIVETTLYSLIKRLTYSPFWMLRRHSFIA